MRGIEHLKATVKAATPHRVKAAVKALLGREQAPAPAPAPATAPTPALPAAPPPPPAVSAPSPEAQPTTAEAAYPAPPVDEASDRRDGTHTPMRGPADRLLTLTAAPDLAALRPFASDIAALSVMYVAHRFDLLGSGWVPVRRGETYGGCEGHRHGPGEGAIADRGGDWLDGVINRSNRARARATWRLASEHGPEEYEPIDWQVDFKSGFRWSEEAWSRSCAYGRLPGVDVKLPWELSRMMHLPTLALAAGLERAGVPGPVPADRLAREVIAQAMDWVATNPPRFGVNWSCTMDVGIRVANLVLARDLLAAQGFALPAEIERALLDSVYEHAAHIVHHFEWFPGLRSNHYLANVAGLLYAASALPRTPQTDAWLGLALQELQSEALIQFHEDGSNFEASTCYHRLSAEMLVWSAARSLAIPEERLAACAEAGEEARAWIPTGPTVGGREGPRPRPGSLRLRTLVGTSGRVITVFGEAFWARAERAARFTDGVTKTLAGGARAVAQIGDMDSGRWHAVAPRVRTAVVSDLAARYATYAEAYAGRDPTERVPLLDHLNHDHLVSAAAGLIAMDAPRLPDRAVVAAVAGLAAPAGLAAAAPRGEARVLYSAALAMPPAARRWTIDAALDVASLERRFFEAFGLFVWRSREPGAFFLAVRCGHTGQLGNGGHAHNDALHLEVVVDGVERSRDPGTYVYTPVPAARNMYRSVAAHCVPRVGDEEPGSFDRGLFTMSDGARAEVLRLTADEFVGRYRQGTATVWRRVRLSAAGVTVEDASEGARLIDSAGVFGADGRWAAPVPFSPGYGVREVSREGGAGARAGDAERAKGAGW